MKVLMRKVDHDNYDAYIHDKNSDDGGDNDDDT